MNKPKPRNLKLNGKHYCSICLVERLDPFPSCPQCYGLILENGRWVQPLRNQPKPEQGQKQGALLTVDPEYPG